MSLTAPSPAALRKRPTQARAQARVNRILQAARKLVEAGPLEAVTTTRIAEAAGLPIGSLYQYFPNRAAILAELARTLVAETDAAALEAIAAARALPVTEAVDHVVDRILSAHRGQTRSAALLQTVYAAPACRGVVDDSNLRIANALADHPALRARGDRTRASRAALVAVVTGEAVQQLALGADDADEAAAVTRELKLLLKSYLTAPVAEAAHGADSRSIQRSTRKPHAANR